jgi:AraC family transcriptional regulator of adaptative response/methylated-DNA-[protein]-cysteine methyltransferase
MKALRAYLGGRAALPDSLPVDLQGTAFQLLVWRYLRSIPHGEAQSYSRVAAGIGRPRAARAVARACATNRVALLVPCHRVVRGSGDIAGYRWGTRRKRALLAAERTARAGRPG